MSYCVLLPTVSVPSQCSSSLSVHPPSVFIPLSVHHPQCMSTIFFYHMFFKLVLRLEKQKLVHQIWLKSVLNMWRNTFLVVSGFLGGHHLYMNLCLSVCPSVPKIVRFSVPPRWLGHLDTGTLGDRDNGILGHHDTGTPRHWNTVLLGH